MALFDYTAGDLIAKIVYYGPDGAGKTTNLRHIHGRLPAASKGELAMVTTPTGNTLVFDFVPADAGRVRGLRMRVQLCALTGPVPSTAARRAVLKGADAVVFVADSQAQALDADVQSIESLYRSLPRGGGDSPTPVVIQYNKRDLAGAVPVETLSQKINPRGAPSFEAIAAQGIGVDETLRVITRLCSRSLAALYGEAAGTAVTSPALDRVRTDTARLELPGAPPRSPPIPAPTAPVRVATPQSLARESLALTPGAADSRGAATLRFDKREVLSQPRVDAEPAKAPPKAPGTKEG
jgi:signal recognition particle receptor subunit beta